MIHARRDVVFVRAIWQADFYILNSIRRIRRARRCYRPQSQIWLDGRNRQRALRGIGNENGARGGRSLADSFIGAENERPVFNNTASARCAVLGAFKRGNVNVVKEISRVQGAVPQKPERAAVECICATLSDCVNNGARGSSVL